MAPDQDAGRYADDVALAQACAAGDEAAWERFVLTYRPILYRSADALDPGGGAREIADSLYAELFGLREREGERLSLFRYFHGRSSLATWLRAVLAQRFVDRIRAERRTEPLSDDEGDHRQVAADEVLLDPNRRRVLELMREALTRAVAQLDARDRLRFACYYAQDLTLAQTGRMLKEHEATCSRQLARTRKALRADVERQLRTERVDDATIAECASAFADDLGTLDIKELMRPSTSSGLRKESAADRSK